MFVIGIILLDTQFPRLLGDVGNPATLPFPVLFERVKGAIPSRVVRERDRALMGLFIEAARNLERRGAKAVTTSCGFLALWQEEIASSVGVPVFTSSLIQVPWAYQLTGGKGRIGVLTADGPSLTKAHFEAVGAGNTPVVVRGMRAGGEFQRIYIDDGEDIDVAKAEGEVASEVSELMKGNPGLSALVLECANLPVFGRAIRATARLPVFDILTLARFIWSTVESTHPCEDHTTGS